MLGIEIIKRLGAGISDGTVILSDTSVIGTQYAQWTLSSNGFTYKRKTAGASVISSGWIFPQSGMDQYEVRATVSSGDTPPGAIGSWEDPTQVWGWAGETTEQSCNLFIEIRRASSGIVVDSATIYLFVAGIL